MQLLRVEEVQANPDDKVYKHSRISGVIFLLIVIGGGVALMVNTYEKSASHAGYYVGAVIILFACLFINYAAAAFRGTNWLVRMSSGGLYVHLRSYLNYKLPPEEATVAFFLVSGNTQLAADKENGDGAGSAGRGKEHYPIYSPGGDGNSGRHFGAGGEAGGRDVGAGADGEEMVWREFVDDGTGIIR